MKKIIEVSDNLYCFVVEFDGGVTTSPAFKKDGDQYKALIAEGVKVELIPQSEKDAYAVRQATGLIKQELAALDVSQRTIIQFLLGDKEAIKRVNESEKQKVLLRAKL